MIIGKLEIVKGFYTFKRWWKYIIPKRLTIQRENEPNTYCWLGFNFGIYKPQDNVTFHHSGIR